MANAVYNSFKKEIQNGTIDLDTDTIKILLVTAAYTPNVDTHMKRSDVTNEVANGNGYATGGIALVNKSVTQDDVNNRGVFDADDAVWAAATFGAAGAVLYKSRGGAANLDELICYQDFGGTVTATGGEFKVQFNASGIMYIG